MAKKIDINFHKSFFPDMEYISKILKIADNYDYITKEEISEITGIPTGKVSGKVEPHIQYSKYMNLINYDKDNKKYLIRKTPLGEIILSEDPYMQENLSKNLCNYFLTSRNFGADMWFQIFRNIPSYLGTEISINVLQLELSKIYTTSSNIKLGPFNGTYTKNNSLKNVNMLKVTESGYEFVPHKYEPQYLFLYAYSLFEELMMLDINRKEFTTEEIFLNIMWNRGFQWSEKMAMEVLDNLAIKGVIHINRQLNPATIIVIKSKEEIINKLYSLII